MKEIIWVVDDNGSILEVVKIRLSMIDIVGKVVIFKSAEEVVKVLETGGVPRPNLLITDFQMGGMDGLQLCEFIQNKYPYISKAIMTGDPSFVDGTRARKAGVAKIFEKPLAENFEKEVRDLLLEDMIIGIQQKFIADNV